MATAAPGLTYIQRAEKYWLEQVPFTFLNSPAANTQTSLFSTNGWQTQGQQGIYTEITALASTQDADLQYHGVYDQEAVDLYGGAFRPSLRPVRGGYGATSNISLSLYNNNLSLAKSNIQSNLLFTSWRMPITYKVLQGFPLTPEETAIAESVGIETQPNNRRGTTPLPWSAIIERTFQNERIDGDTDIPLQPQATTASTQFAQYVANANELFVLRNVAMEGTLDEGVQITVDRDADLSYLVLNAASTDLERGIDMFVPALSQFNFNIVSTTATATKTPIRLTIWRLALSNILRIRLGLLTLGQLQSLIGANKANKLWADVLVGLG